MRALRRGSAPKGRADALAEDRLGDRDHLGSLGCASEHRRAEVGDGVRRHHHIVRQPHAEGVLDPEQQLDPLEAPEAEIAVERIAGADLSTRHRAQLGQQTGDDRGELALDQRAIGAIASFDRPDLANSISSLPNAGSAFIAPLIIEEPPGNPGRQASRRAAQPAQSPRQRWRPPFQHAAPCSSLPSSRRARPGALLLRYLPLVAGDWMLGGSRLFGLLGARHGTAGRSPPPGPATPALPNHRVLIRNTPSELCAHAACRETGASPRLPSMPIADSLPRHPGCFGMRGSGVNNSVTRSWAVTGVKEAMQVQVRVLEDDRARGTSFARTQSDRLRGPTTR